MDIEGSEVAAIRGAKQFFKKFNYPIVFCESNKWTLFLLGETTKSLKEEFYKIGYKAYYMSRVDKKLHLYEDEIQIDCVHNIYFIHDDISLPDNIFSVLSIKKNYLERLYNQLFSENVCEIIGTISDFQDYPNIIENTKIKKRLWELRNEYSENIQMNYALSKIKQYL